MKQQTAVMLYTMLAAHWRQELSRWRAMPPGETFTRRWEQQGERVAQAYREMVEAYKVIDPSIVTAWVPGEKR